MGVFFLNLWSVFHQWSIKDNSCHKSSLENSFGNSEFREMWPTCTPQNKFSLTGKMRQWERVLIVNNVNLSALWKELFTHLTTWKGLRNVLEVKGQIIKECVYWGYRQTSYVYILHIIASHWTATVTLGACIFPYRSADVMQVCRLLKVNTSAQRKKQWPLCWTYISIRWTRRGRMP